MINWTYLKNSNKLRILALISIISLVIGFILFLNIKNSVNIDQINLENILRNNILIHIFIFFVIFFLSFIFLGSIFGIIIYSFEIICYINIILFLIFNFSLKGLFLSVLLICFRLPYYLLLFLTSLNSLKISKFIICKENRERVMLMNYIKKSVLLSIIAISIELFNYFLGYKIIIFLSNLLGIMI